MRARISNGRNRRLAVLGMAAASAVGVLAGRSEAAVSLTWDSDGTTTTDIKDGSGNWNTTGSNTVWRNGASNVAWTTLNDAIFGGTSGTPGTVTLTTAITPNSMTFNVDGYTIADASTSVRLILASPGGITANGNATVKTFRASVSQTESQTWTVAPNKSFTMDASPGVNTSQFFIGGNADLGKSLTLAGGGTVNFIASSNTFGLNVPQNSNLVVNNALVTVTGRTTATNLDDVAIVIRSRTGAGLAGKATINTGGTIDIGTNTVTVQLNSDGTFQPTGAPGELHLDGGTIALGSFGNATAATPLSSTGALYFNGGEVKANKSNPNFMVAPFVTGVGGSGLSAVYVGANGANINTNAFNITVATPLIPDPASAGGGFTKKGAGTLTLTAASTYTGTSAVQGGTLIANNAAALSSGPLTVSNLATVQLQAMLPTAMALKSVTTAGSGKVDLTDNAMVVKNTSLTEIDALVTLGYNNGDWKGPGITSSKAETDPNGLTAVGYFNNADFGATQFEGVSGLDNDDILVKYTYYGDTDLNGLVDADDFNQFLAGFQDSSLPRTWLYGDFDYNNLIDADDFNLFLATYQFNGAQLSELVSAIELSSLSAADQQTFLGAVAAVPEPASLGLLAVAAGGFAIRRRRP